MSDHDEFRDIANNAFSDVERAMGTEMYALNLAAAKKQMEVQEAHAAAHCRAELAKAQMLRAIAHLVTWAGFCIVLLAVLYFIQQVKNG